MAHSSNGAWAPTPDTSHQQQRWAASSIPPGAPLVVELDWAQVAPSPRLPGHPLAPPPDRAVARRAGPAKGWRRWVYRLTGGVVDPGPSGEEMRRRQQLTRIQGRLDAGCHTVSVVATMGGVGTTTVAALLGVILASCRDDRVLAVDASQHTPMLAERVLGRPPARTVGDLIQELDQVPVAAAVARYAEQADRLEVLGSVPDSAPAITPFDAAGYRRLMDLLARLRNVLIVDSGTDLLHLETPGTSHTVVVVSAPTSDAVHRTGNVLDQLCARGHDRLVSDAIVVLTCDRVSAERDRTSARAHFAARCRAVVEIPADPHLARGGHVTLAQLRPATHEAAMALAAHVADQFHVSLGISHPAAGRAPSSMPPMS